jgi:hypothetical protein
MQSLQETLSAWTTLFGTILSVVGLIQSRAWLTVISASFALVALAVGLYARRERLAVTSASIKVEGHSIDSLNLANLRRRVNRSLVLQKADHLAEISGEDLHITWHYTGYCHAEKETVLEFSIDSDNRVPFGSLECFAYDLGRDPERKHKIRPVLIGADGNSKKVAVPLLAPLSAKDRFDVVLHCHLLGCVKPGFGYYTSTLSFNQDVVPSFGTRLVFAGVCPLWVRVYECGPTGETVLLRDLRPAGESAGRWEHEDAVENVPGQMARIYVFWRGEGKTPGQLATKEERL